MTALAQAVAVADTSAATSTVVSATLASPPTPGNLLIAVTLMVNATTTVHPWGVPPHIAAVNTTVARESIYSKVAVPGEPSTISVTFASSATTYRLAVYEVAPTAGLAWLGFDGSGSAADAGVAAATLSSGTTPPTSTPDGIAVAAWGMNGAPGAFVSITNGFTATPMQSGWTAHKILTGTGPQESTLTWTGARRVGAAIATFKQGVPVSSAGFLALL